ncbi:MAG: N-acetylneuraminate synthase [Bdellovibrionales bacterium]|nr:N-acetylneuraminate synthase [Bdellovibrionales bacterium]
MNRVLVIAEACVNHNGDLDIAKKMIDAAAAAGADIVKFQTFKTEKLVSKTAKKAEYQQQNSAVEETQYEMLKKLEISEAAHIELIRYCKERGIEFLSTAFDLDSLKFLKELGLRLFKVPSGELTNYPLLKSVGAFNLELIVSTGMANLGEVEQAVNTLVEAGTDRNHITILHCNTEYPTPLKDVNLSAMMSIKDGLKLRIGYSDHTLGITVPIAAVALGATVIEKHFTLDRELEGPDHRASLLPGELRDMVTAIREVELCMGDGIKRPSESEKKNIAIARKSIAAGKNISEGEVFSEGNLTTLRPGDGLSPMLWEEVIGREARRNFSEGELIEL